MEVRVLRGQASLWSRMGRAHAPPAAMRPRRASRRSPWPSIALVAFAAIVASRGVAASADDDGSSSIPVSLATRDSVATRADTYTYTSVAMPDGDHYIHRFEPRASAKVVHHMLLFGCSGDASPTLRTREGGMFSADGGGQPRGAVCAGSDPEPFIFGWGKDAPDLHLPDGIGFRVGGDFGFKTLVLETHYLEKFAPKKTNDTANDANDATSGVTVHLKPGVPRRFMSVLAYAQGFVLPPRERRTEVKTVCAYTDSAPLAAYAFRVHTHALGVEVFLEKAVAGVGFENPRPTEESRVGFAKPFRPAPIKLASRDPQLPQLFEVVAGEETEKDGSTSFDIAPGDALRVTCVFDTSNRTSVTRAGWGHGDEMCNLYLMVHAEEPRYASCTGSASGGAGARSLTSRAVSKRRKRRPSRRPPPARSSCLRQSWTPRGDSWRSNQTLRGPRLSGRWAAWRSSRTGGTSGFSTAARASGAAVPSTATFPSRRRRPSPSTPSRARLPDHRPHRAAVRRERALHAARLDPGAERRRLGHGRRRARGDSVRRARRVAPRDVRLCRKRAKKTSRADSTRAGRLFPRTRTPRAFARPRTWPSHRTARSGSATGTATTASRASTRTARSSTSGARRAERIRRANPPRKKTRRRTRTTRPSVSTSRTRSRSISGARGWWWRTASARASRNTRWTARCSSRTTSESTATCTTSRRSRRRTTACPAFTR